MKYYRVQKLKKCCKSCHYSGRYNTLPVTCVFDKTIEKIVNPNGICDNYKKRQKKC